MASKKDEMGFLTRPVSANANSSPFQPPTRQLPALALALAASLNPPGALAAPNSPFSPTVPPAITTPEVVPTRIGTLRFQDGAPDGETVRRAYDQLDFGRGVEAFLRGLPASSVEAICGGLAGVGVTANQAIGISERLFDARSLFLTPNTTTPYVLTCLDLTAGPVVLRVPPGVLGPVDDADFRWVVDVGLTGPDKGAGGTYLFVPPGYRGPLPAQGFHVARPRTNRLLVFYRAFVEKGDLAGAVARVKGQAAVFSLARAAAPAPTRFVNLSGLRFNTIGANDFSFYEELNRAVQHAPADWVDPDTVGLYASIGLRKGQPFAPDARLRAILTDAVAVGNAIARSQLFASRDPRTRLFADRQWLSPFMGGSDKFLDGAERMLDARTMFFYYATGITPAMIAATPGSGSAYAATFRDANGAVLDGGRTYRLTLPAPIPVKTFWALTVYDNQTRSLLPTDQRLAGVDSTLPGLRPEPDGSVTVWFGPRPPAGRAANWVQTQPGRGFNAILRLYGPLEPWFARTWRPGDLVPIP